MLSQKQVRDLIIPDVATAATKGRADEVAFVQDQTAFFKYVIDNTLTADGAQILTASGTDAFWVKLPAGLPKHGTSTTDMGEGIYHIDASAGNQVFALPAVSASAQNRYQITTDIGDGFTVTITSEVGDKLLNVDAGTLVLDDKSGESLLEISNDGVDTWAVNTGNSILRAGLYDIAYEFPQVDFIASDPSQLSTTTGNEFISTTSMFTNGSKVIWFQHAADEIRSFDMDATDVTGYTGANHTAFDPALTFTDSVRFNVSDDGSKMYLVYCNNGPITYWQYSLGTAFDIATASFDGTGSLAVNADFQTDVRFSADGLRIFFKHDTINRYDSADLDVAWDLHASTLSNIQVGEVVTTAPRNFQLVKNGKGIQGYQGSVMYFIELATAYDITSNLSSGSYTPAGGMSMAGAFYHEANAQHYMINANNLFTFTANPTGVTLPGGGEVLYGLVTDPLRFVDGNEGLGKVWTSDANGEGSWQTQSASSSLYTDDGTIEAARTVTMGGNPVTFKGATRDTVITATGQVISENYLVGAGTSQLAPLQIETAVDMTTSQPAGPADLAIYLNTITGTGSIDTGVNFDKDKLYSWKGGVRTETTPVPGWEIYVKDSDTFMYFDGTTWQLRAGKNWVFSTNGMTASPNDKIIVQSGHTINLPANPTNPDEINLVPANGDWVALGATIATTDAFTVGAGQADIVVGADTVRLIAIVGDTNWLVASGGETAPPQDEAYTNVADLPVAGTVPVGRRAIVTDPAEAGIYIATGTVGGASATSWVKS